MTDPTARKTPKTDPICTQVPESAERRLPFRAGSLMTGTNPRRNPAVTPRVAPMANPVPAVMRQFVHRDGLLLGNAEGKGADILDAHGLASADSECTGFTSSRRCGVVG